MYPSKKLGICPTMLYLSSLVEVLCIDIVENDEPLHNLECVGCGLSPLGNPDTVCNVSIALLKPCCVTRVDPETHV
jgi:hypothetical protein